MLGVWYHRDGRSQPEKYPDGCLLVRDRVGFVLFS